MTTHFYTGDFNERERVLSPNEKGGPKAALAIRTNRPPSRPDGRSRAGRSLLQRTRVEGHSGAAPGCDFDAALRELRAAGWGRWSLGGRWRLRERWARDLAANANGPTIKAMGKAPNETNAEISRAGRFWRVS